MTNTVVLKTNLPDFKRQMKQLSLDVQRKAVRSAMFAACGVLRAAVKAKAAEPKSPKPRRPRTGTLARAVYMVRNRRGSTKGTEAFVVGVRSGRKAAKTGRDAFYWRFLEAGWIPRGPGQALRGGDRSKRLQRQRAVAGGAKVVQYPFIQPAFVMARGRAIEVFEKRMDREIQKLSARR